MGTQNTDPAEDIMMTMDRLQKELDKLDQARQDLSSSPKGYTTQTVSSARIYSTQPKKFAPVTAPKPSKKTVGGFGGDGSALPPPGPHSKGPPPPTLPKPGRASKQVPPAPPPKTSPRHQQFSTAAMQSHTQVTFPKQEDFLPPPPPNSRPTYTSPGDDFLPPPPPELIGGGQGDLPLPPPPPPAPVTMQTYNEPRPPPQPQPSYNKPAYQRAQPPQQQQNGGAAASYKPIPSEPPKSYGGPAVPKPTDQPVSSPAKKGTEAEIDALTNLLMQNMETSSEEGEFFGICAKCNMKVVGDNNGCTAMDQVYHIDCFTCDTCHTKLRGFPFFALEGKAFCETCYMDSLEKCSTCSQPITERILRATGKPYHPHCFTCVVCGKSLDGIPFTVDATNQIHCIEDFHKKFAPRCSVCLQPIMPEPGQEETVRIVALDRSFHVNCYKCEDCSALLSSEADGRGCFPLDDHILCRDCNTKRVQALTAP